ncbi:MAG: hypothetical protein KAI81_04005 [Candidatus Marinimicrobia bacterium]|nr:hypothetical protein [Candidatus Neomarinimicrobiota bacterium]
MKTRIISLIVTSIFFAGNLFAAQIVGNVSPEKSKKLLRDLNIMEEVLEEHFSETDENNVKFKFSVNAIYFDGIGVIINAGSYYGKSIQYQLQTIFEDLEFPELPEFPDIQVFIGDSSAESANYSYRYNSRSRDSAREKERVRVKIDAKEVEKIKEEVKLQKEEFNKLKMTLEKDRKRIKFTREKNLEDIKLVREKLNHIAEEYYVTTLSGLRNLDNSDKVVLNIKLPLLSSMEEEAQSINLSCKYSDIRDFRREKISEKDFRKKISENSDISAALQKDLGTFGDIMWNLAVEDPYWMFTSKVTHFYMKDLGAVYTFNAYMVEKTLKHIQALAEDILVKKDKKAIAELSKEQTKRRESLINDVLETSGTYINLVKNLPKDDYIICLFEMNDSHYGLDDASLMIKMKKSDLVDFYKEKINSKELEKRTEVVYTPVKK